MEHLSNLGGIVLSSDTSGPSILKKRLLLEIVSNAWTAVKVGLVLVMCYMIATASRQLHSNLPLPVKMHMTSTDKPTISQERVQLTSALKRLGCSQGKIPAISEGILMAARVISVPPKLILALLFTESEFNMKARSPKGYSGLMQTPRASMEYADVDILYGARILEAKMKSPAARKNGRLDMRTAIALYKGGLSGEAFRYSDAVLALYKRINTASY